MLSKDVRSWKGIIHNRTWELQKLSSKIKLYDSKYEFIYRFTLDEWETIRKQFGAALRKKKLA
jgi:hypothetical protein